MISLDEARARVLVGLGPGPRGVERVPLDEAVGRVLAEPLVSGVDLPAFDASAMDGYAVATAELGAPPFALPVEGESRAGGEAGGAGGHRAGGALRIFTGAPLPPWADAVLPQERASLAGGQVTFEAAPARGANVRRRGEDLARGALALGAGARLGAAQVPMLAALGLRDVPVARRPRVALLAVGDELCDPGGGGGAASVVDSNGPMLAALVRQAGGEPRRARVGDDREAVRAALRDAFASADLVVTSGGVSVGAYDYVRRAFEDEGVAFDFGSVAVKPGKPVAFGRRGGAPALGLPGNPAAAFVTFAMLGLPIVRALQGDLCPAPAPLPARLAGEARAPEGRVELARARLTWGPAALGVELVGGQSSAGLAGLAAADALAWLSAPGGRLPAGSAVPVSPLALL
ncbi:MAG TPA: gephyrin-like molybdotransferase Glp [Polyangiaceae bacterium]|nr:gephyrin-like molybdotransferase Glp [Polyangiaceae bacterium]